jgi:hypothetical protein
MNEESLNKILTFLIKATRGGKLDGENRAEAIEQSRCLDNETASISTHDANLLLSGIEARNLSMRGDVVPTRDLDTPIVSDEQLLRCFKNTSYPDLTDDADKQRAYLAQACLKTQAGYWNGHTIFNIMLELNLVEDTTSPKLTLLGGMFLYRYFKNNA